MIFRLVLFCLAYFCLVVQAKADDGSIKPLEQYYLDGFYEYFDRNYTTSSEQFEALSRNYPSSSKTRDSLVMEIFLNYINDETKKIDGIAEVFFKLFPNDEYTAYVKYMKAMGYYSVVGDETRSMDSVIKCKLLFGDLIATFPDSKYSEDAKKKIQYLDKLAQLNDIKIGEFYFERRNYIGAMKRFTGLYQKYPELIPEIEERALCRLVVLSKMLKIDSNVAKYENKLKEKFPNTTCKF